MFSSKPHPKQVLRRHYRQVRDTLDRRAERSAAICARVAALPAYLEAHTLHCYLPIRSEVDTLPLLRDALAQGKRIVVPVVEQGKRTLTHTLLPSLAERELVVGVFGTLQPRTLCPVDDGMWDMVLVPLLAFDRAGYRLGYGKGFYDRLLALSSASTVSSALSVLPVPSVGLAFAAQEAQSLPHEPHDRPLSQIVTEHEVIMPAE